jgi:glutamate-5-semialdehyde dehydrogenase
VTDSPSILDLCRDARAAARATAARSAAERASILEAMAGAIEDGAAAVLQANAADLEAAAAAGAGGAILDRLRLTPARVAGLAAGVRQVAGLPDPLGHTLARFRRPNGLLIEKVRVPLGVILVIYEARPNVTADAAALCFKAGSSVILRGGGEARRSNVAIHAAMLEGGCAAGLPPGAIQLVGDGRRRVVHELLGMEGWIDLVIPRGGEDLIRAVAQHSRIPVLKHYKGVCHVYVDRGADLEMAHAIVVNAKCQRPGVCNAMESLLVHQDVARAFLGRVGPDLLGRGVELRGDEATRALLPAARAATEADWSTEHLDLILSVRVVPDLDAAIEHIERYGTRHSDAIVTADAGAARRFTALVDSAAVYVNASTRFTDGFEFGFGAEIGISTDKLHARGPCGVEELTTYKYVIQGSGQIREDGAGAAAVRPEGGPPDRA